MLEERGRRYECNGAIARAERYLRTAKMLLGDYASSVTRSYYPMFYVACAVLRRAGSEPQTHSGLRNQFGLHFVKEGPLSERFAGMLNDAEEMRTLADYGEGSGEKGEKERGNLTPSETVSTTAFAFTPAFKLSWTRPRRRTNTSAGTRAARLALRGPDPG